MIHTFVQDSDGVDTGPMVLARGQWPPPGSADPPPAVPGFIVSSFAPLVIAAAEQCLRQRYGGAPPAQPDPLVSTAIVLASRWGDLETAAAVARAVDTEARVSPLLFFQSVPNSAAGYVAARWGLAGPVVCLSPAGETTGDSRTDDGEAVDAALAAAQLLLDDGEADEVLVIVADQAVARSSPAGEGTPIEQTATRDGPHRATAVLVRAGDEPRPEATTNYGMQEGSR